MSRLDHVLIFRLDHELVSRLDHELVSRLDALNITFRWCKDRGLTINLSKTIIVPFTRRKKYLGIILVNCPKLPIRQPEHYVSVNAYLVKRGL